MKATTFSPILKQAANHGRAAVTGTIKQQMKIVSFNILAPCFLRMNKFESRRKYYEECKKEAKVKGHHAWELQQTASPDILQRRSWEKPRMESDCKHVWKQRIRKIIQILKYIDADVMALQEFWIENKEYVEMFQEAFVDDKNIITEVTKEGIIEETEGINKQFELYTVQRPNKKQDGVATLVNREKFKVKNVKKVNYKLQGSRVALLLELECRVTGKRFVVANTHLTFPHHDFDKKSLRPNQVASLVDELKKFQNETGTKDIILAGDFNTDKETRIKGMRSKDPILPEIQKHFSNTALSYNMASHLNHNDEIVGADYIFQSRDTSLKLVAPPPSSIFDSKLPEIEEMVSYCPLDEASTPMASVEKIPQSYLFPLQYPSSQWYIPILDVSDHRPLIAHFSL